MTSANPDLAASGGDPARSGAGLRGELSSEQEQELLRARARALARKAAPDADAGQRLEVLEFRLGQEAYAVEASQVVEVCPLRTLRALPGTELLGVTHLRGRVLSVLDVKRVLGVAGDNLTDHNLLVVVAASGLETGLLAHTVQGLRSLERDELGAPLPTLAGTAQRYVRGMGREGLVLLDLERLLRGTVVDTRGAR